MDNPNMVSNTSTGNVLVPATFQKKTESGILRHQCLAKTKNHVVFVLMPMRHTVEISRHTHAVNSFNRKEIRSDGR